MEDRSVNGYDFSAPQYVENLEKVALVDEDGADAYFDVTDQTEQSSNDLLKTPDRAASPNFEAFMTPCASMAKKKGRAESARKQSKAKLVFSAKKVNINEEVTEMTTGTNDELMEDDDVISDLLDVKLTLGQGTKGRKSMAIIGGEKRVVRKARRRWSTSLSDRNKIEDVLKEFTKGIMANSNISKTFDGIELLPPPPGSAKKHSMRTRQDSDVSKETLNLRGRKVLKRRDVSPIAGPPPNKYLTLAEAVYHFHKDTPPRFHSNPKTISAIMTHFEKPKLTMANSPALVTKTRARHTNILPQEERELRMIEEMKKEHILVHPLNEKIIKKPQTIVKPEPKPSTVPEPFNLTEVHKKDLQIQEVKPYSFKAQPIPKAVLEPISLASKRIRVPVLKIENGELKEGKGQVSGGLRATENSNNRISLAVNSYERGMEMIRKREAKIKQILEEDKKKREFHAQPLPTYLVSKMNSTANSTVCSELSRKGETDENMEVSFRARPATVLQKKPFVPKKATKPHMEIVEFDLNTGRRAKEREKFDKMVKIKEELKELNKEIGDGQPATKPRGGGIGARASVLPPLQKRQSLMVRPGGKTQ